MNKEWCPYCHAMTYEDIYGHCCACGGARGVSIRTSDGYTKISDMSDEELYSELKILSSMYQVDLPPGTFRGYSNDAYNKSSGSYQLFQIQNYAEECLIAEEEFFNDMDAIRNQSLIDHENGFYSSSKLYQASRKVKNFFGKVFGIR